MEVVKMIIGVVGSRTGIKREAVFKALEDEPFVDAIITGGAKGADTYAAEWAFKKKIKCIIIRPINPNNKLDYLFRNVEIIAMSDKIHAHWDGASRGTKFVMDYASARLKNVSIFQ